MIRFHIKGACSGIWLRLMSATVQYLVRIPSAEMPKGSSRIFAVSFSQPVKPPCQIRHHHPSAQGRQGEEDAADEEEVWNQDDHCRKQERWQIKRAVIFGIDDQTACHKSQGNAGIDEKIS